MVQFKLSDKIPFGEDANLGGAVVGVLANNIEMRLFETHPSKVKLVNAMG